MNFSRGCHAILNLMGPLIAPSSPNSSCSDGYHSDSDSMPDENNSELVRQYRTLYITHRTDTLNALDNLAQLRHVNNLKIKILFSITVVSLTLLL